MIRCCHAGHSKGGDTVLVYASRYDDVPRVVNCSARFNLRDGERSCFVIMLPLRVYSPQHMHELTTRRLAPFFWNRKVACSSNRQKGISHSRKIAKVAGSNQQAGPTGSVQALQHFLPSHMAGRRSHTLMMLPNCVFLLFITQHQGGVIHCCFSAAQTCCSSRQELSSLQASLWPQQASVELLDVVPYVEKQVFGACSMDKALLVQVSPPALARTSLTGCRKRRVLR